MNFPLVSAIIFIAASLNSTHGCFCPGWDAKTFACRSKFVLLADVTQETRTGSHNETITYELIIKEVFKAEGEARSLARQDGKFTVETNEWLDCRVFMEEGAETLVTGYVHQDALNVDGCQFVRAWNLLSDAEKSGFRSQYYQQCAVSTAAPRRG